MILMTLPTFALPGEGFSPSKWNFFPIDFTTGSRGKLRHHRAVANTKQRGKGKDTLPVPSVTALLSNRDSSWSCEEVSGFLWNTGTFYFGWTSPPVSQCGHSRGVQAIGAELCWWTFPMVGANLWALGAEVGFLEGDYVIKIGKV